MMYPSLSLFTLLAAVVLFIGKAHAALTIVATGSATQLEYYTFSYSVSPANPSVVYYRITINGVVVSPPSNTALSFTYLVQCSDLPGSVSPLGLNILVEGLDITNTPVPGESSTALVPVIFNYGCPVASATFVGAGGNSVPVKSSQVVSVTPAINLASVDIFFDGIYVCTITALVAEVPKSCTSSFVIPCAALGSNVPLEMTAVLPGGTIAPTPPVSNWFVDWVAGQCAAQLVLLNLNGNDPTVIPTNCIQFGLQLDPTDDPTLYYNFAIETVFPGQVASSNILNACMLDLSVAGETIAEANQSAYLIGSWKIPCSLNLQGQMTFLSIFSRKTVGASSVETMSSSAQAIIGENAVCEVVLVNPVVTRPACTGPAIVMDAAGGYLQAFMVGDSLVFSVKIGDDLYYTYSAFQLAISATGLGPIIIPLVAPIVPNSCNVFPFTPWVIPPSFAGATNVTAVLTYTATHGATVVPKTITMCLAIVPNECPVPVIP